MLLSKEIAQVGADLRAEAEGRPYVELLMPEVISDDSFWRMLIEILEIVLHRRGYVIARREDVVSSPF